MAIQHELLGARMAELAGRRVPRHYGDPAAEYDAARTSAVVVDRADRVVLRVTGRDPVRMLHGLATNDLAGAAEDAAVYTAFLTPKGRMVAEARLVRRSGAVLVETAAAAEEGLRAHFRKYLPPLFARVEEGAVAAILGLYGPHAHALARERLPAGALTLPPLDVPAGEGVEVLVDPDALEPRWAELIAAPARPAGHAALEVLRIEAGRPRWGAELDDTVIPLEAGLLERAISTTKGCYTGQEVIVRILHRGHVNRHLRGLLLGDAPVPACGTSVTAAGPGEVTAAGAGEVTATGAQKVTAAGAGEATAAGAQEIRAAGVEKPVGAVTSACASPRFAQTIALAYLRREVALGSRVLVEGNEAMVVVLPFGPQAAATEAEASSP